MKYAGFTAGPPRPSVSKVRGGKSQGHHRCDAKHPLTENYLENDEQSALAGRPHAAQFSSVTWFHPRSDPGWK